MSAPGFSSRRPRFERLEKRRLLAQVNVLTDGGVIDPNDFEVSLREAIELSPAGEVITFADNVRGVIELDPMLGSLVITRSMTIQGPGADGLTIQGTNRRLFTIRNLEADLAVGISGLTLTGGREFNETNGGAILNAETLELNDSIVTGNQTGGNGGAIVNYGGRLTIRRSTVSNNDAYGRGGAIAGDSGRIEIFDSVISGNTAGDSGGAISSYGDMLVSRSTISGNTSVFDGGGIQSRSGSPPSFYRTVEIIDSTISGNSASSPDADGGGIAVENGILRIINSTVSGNSAESGGGVYGEGVATSIAFSTITNNSGPANGGGIDVAGGSLAIHGSIVAGNNSSNGPDLFVLGTPSFSANASLIGSNEGTLLPATPLGGANGNKVGGPPGQVLDPRLGPLADNGGPTRTHALLPSSPAVDAGPETAPAGFPFPAFDQRGTPFTRLVDFDLNGAARIDMGAFELVRDLVVDVNSDVVNGDLSPGDVSLRELILRAHTVPGFNLIRFADSLSGQRIALQTALPTIAVPLTIDATSLQQKVIVDAAGVGRVFTVDNNAATTIAVTLAGMRLTGGNTPGDGGAVFSAENLTINDCELAGNQAARGGGLFVQAGTAAVNASTIEGNLARSVFQSGGGIYNQDGIVDIVASTIQNNIARQSMTAGEGDGGGVLNLNGELTIEQSTISGNVAGDSGGGVYNVRGQVVIQSSTISGNTASDSGGGVYNWNAAQGGVSIRFSTITDNLARAGRGAGVAANGTLNHQLLAPLPLTASGVGPGIDVHSSIVAGNRVGGDVVAVGIFNRPTAYFRSDGYNLVGDGNAANAFARAGVDLVGIANPGLAPLAQNGGPTRTHALTPGSPAINPQLSPRPSTAPDVTDQRGFLRLFDNDSNGLPDGPLDIGAFELGATPPPPPVPLSASLAGDFNHDGAVDLADLSHPAMGFVARFGDPLGGVDVLAWQRNLGGAASSAPSASLAGDFDHNGVVNAQDLSHPGLGWIARLGHDLDGADVLAWQRRLGDSLPVDAAFAASSSFEAATQSVSPSTETRDAAFAAAALATSPSSMDDSSARFAGRRARTLRSAPR